MLAGALAAMTLAACTSPVTTADGSSGDTGDAADAVTPSDTFDVAAQDVAAGDASTDDTAPTDALVGEAGLVGARPYNRRIPAMYNPSQPTPLVIMLHGYGASGALEDLYLHLGQLAATRGFLYAYPDGTLDSTLERFWNATDACCDFEHRNIDDVAYVHAVIDDMSARYNVDARRVFLVGHSNGGFMSHRLACELSPRIAGIVSLAGAVWNDMTRCTPTSPVAVLDVHGDLDTTVSYAGGAFGLGPMYPGEFSTLAGWATRNHCTGSLADTGMSLDLEATIPGAETSTAAYTGCPEALVELWTIHGGSHIPTFTTEFAPRIYDWLMAHPRR